jgi:hypothetical protein
MAKIKMNVTSEDEGIPKVGLEAFNDLAKSHDAHVKEVERLQKELDELNKLKLVDQKGELLLECRMGDKNHQLLLEVGLNTILERFVKEGNLGSLKQLDCEGIDISAEKGKVNIEEIAPYMNETPICEQTFIDCKFERVDVSAEESGDEAFHYYSYEFGTTYDPSLISAKNFTGVQLFNEEYKTWHTEGELQLLFMVFLKEGD